MKNNIAEIKDVSINIEELRTAWVEQVKFAGNYSYGQRNYVDLDWFIPYFQYLLLETEKALGIKPKNYIIQVADPALLGKEDPNSTNVRRNATGEQGEQGSYRYQDKYYLTIPHTDYDRASCVTFPITYNLMEPVNFWNDLADEDVPDRGKPMSIKPSQTSQYSTKHPTLINVHNHHNVRVIDKDIPRIFVQMSYDEHFDDLVKNNPNIEII
jgi:hypothetical protein